MRQPGFRQVVSEVHTWAGLVLGWVLFFVFVTGTAGYFTHEIDRWMQPELPVMRQVAADRALELAEQHLRREAPTAQRWSVGLPDDRRPSLRLSWREGGRTTHRQLDPESARILHARDTGGGDLLYEMHYKLHYLPSAVSTWIVGVATMFMLVAIVTGVIVHRKIFIDFFTFRIGRGQRSWLDAHNILAVVALPFHLMITYSGLLFYSFAYTLMPFIVALHYGAGDANWRVYVSELRGRPAEGRPSGTAAPLAPLAPLVAQAEALWGERQVQSLNVFHSGDVRARVVIHKRAATLGSSEQTVTFDGVSGALLAGPAVSSTPYAVTHVLLDLHEGLFADAALRWLYFLSGVLGTAMIATGLVHWTAKRRQRLESARGMPHFGLALVERLNIGTVAGLPIAIAAYFWANRLLPVDFSARAAWEAHVMFIVWGLMLLHAALHSPRRAWAQQWWVAAAACGFIPVLNALTTDRHLGVSLPEGDWAFAGFDLTMCVFGIAFAYAATKAAAR